MRAFACVCVVAILSIGAFGQTSEATAKFEVADIHTSPRSPQVVLQGPFFSTSRYEIRFATMLDLIRMAYDVDPEKVSGGPSWLEMDRFDVFAKTPTTSTA